MQTSCFWIGVKMNCVENITGNTGFFVKHENHYPLRASIILNTVYPNNIYDDNQNNLE